MNADRNTCRYELNTDFEALAMGAKELTALVVAWQQGAISRDTLLHNLRAGELLPPVRTNEQEAELMGIAGARSVKREAGSMSVKGEESRLPGGEGRTACQ